MDSFDCVRNDSINTHGNCTQFIFGRFSSSISPFCSPKRRTTPDHFWQCINLSGSCKIAADTMGLHSALQSMDGWVYERLVRAVKTPLRKVLGQSLVWEKELSTLIVEVERLVNSRPLTHVGGEDELEFEQPVTPSMLMGWVWQEKPLSDSKPAADQEKESLPARAKYLKKLQEHLTHRWEKEYVSQLRLFKDISRKSIKEGDVVLIADAKKKRMEWKLGLVTKTHKGRDGRIRVAEVRRGRSTFLRSVHCLLPLEVS